MTRLKLIQRSICYTMFRTREIFASYKPPSAWQAEKLQALSLDITSKDCPYVTQWDCSILTYLKLHNVRVNAENDEEMLSTQVPSLEHFNHLKKLRLHNLPICNKESLLEQFSSLTRCVSHMADCADHESWTPLPPLLVSQDIKLNTWLTDKS